MQILKRHGCQNSVAMVTSILTYTLQRLQNAPRYILENVRARFGGPCLKGFEVFKPFIDEISPFCKIRKE